MNIPSQPHKLTQKEYVDFLETKINDQLGFFYWKKYVAAAFWSNISTPINLIITLLTALTTAQATSPNLISDNIYRQISVVSLIITVLNTFFRPHMQMTTNIDSMRKWNEMGIEFEKIYFDDLDCDYTDSADVMKSIQQYTALQDKMNELRKAEGPSTTNFLTDLIHLIAMATCIRKNRTWIHLYPDVSTQRIQSPPQEIGSEKV